MFFSISKYQTKCVIKFFKIFFGSSSKAMANREKTGEDGNTKCNYFENKKSFLIDETKSIFHNYLRAMIW